MGIVNGNGGIRAGDTDPIPLSLLLDDGVTPIDLTGISGLTLRMEDTADGTTKNFTTPKFIVIDALLGKVKLSPAADDFPDAARYEYCVSFTDGAGKIHTVPKQKNYTCVVIKKIGP